MNPEEDSINLDVNQDCWLKLSSQSRNVLFLPK
jgi:hypothetical protein